MERALPQPDSARATPAAPGDERTLLDGRYQLEEQIGRGGMGRVFAATDRKLERKVAIKLLPPGEHQPQDLQRFEREARAAASLQQPGILEVHDVGVWQGEPYIVSELLQGGTLRERLAAGPLPPEEARGLALQLARALAAAHAGGVVHRDLKPENLFVTADGRLKVLDFGIAKLSSAPTTSGAILGTVQYMAPEQVRGGEVDARTDLFAFGSVLYEMLSGRAPFSGATGVETGFAVISREPPPLDAPADLARVVSACLRKDPRDRPQSAGELIALLEGKPVLRRRPSRWAPAAAALVLLSWPPGPARVVAPLEKQIAVLPFRSVGGGEAEQAFCLGLTELVASKLRQLEGPETGLRVVSASEMAREKVTGARDARAAFGATLVLEGSVHWSAERAVATVELVETATQIALASRDADAPRSGAGLLPAALAKKAAEMLEVKPETLSADPPGADEFYLQARGYLQRYDRMENLEAALRVLEHADPGSALAAAARAEAYLRIYQLTHAPDVLALASDGAEKAARLGDGLAPVQITAGLVRLARGDRDGAISALEQALRIDPRNGDALRELANAYEAAGRAADAEVAYRRAIEVRRGSWAAWKDLGIYYVRHGRLREAATALERVAALTPDSYSAYSNLGGIYLKLGRMDEAGAALRRSVGLRPTAFALNNLATLEYSRGRFAAAADLFARAAELSPSDERIWGSLGDAARFVPGREAQAREALSRALELTEAQLALDGQNPQLHARRAIHFSALGAHGRAEEEIRQALQAAPGDGFVLFRAAIVHQQAGRRDDARTALRAALQAGWSPQEIAWAPALKPLLQEQEFAQLGAAREVK